MEPLRFWLRWQFTCLTNQIAKLNDTIEQIRAESGSFSPPLNRLSILFNSLTIVAFLLLSKRSSARLHSLLLCLSRLHHPQPYLSL